MQEIKKKYNNYKTKEGFPGGSVVKKINLPSRRSKFSPLVGKIP